MARTKVKGGQLDLSNIAGAGLTQSSGVLSVDINGLTAAAEALHQDNDFLMYSDAGTEKKISFSNFEDNIFGNVSGDATIAAGGALTITAQAVENSMLADDAVGADELAANAVVNASIASSAAIDLDKLDGGSCANALTDLAQGDFLYAGDVDDSNNIKNITFSNFEDAIFGNVTGDATIAAGGALTIAATSVENGMLAGSIVASKMNNAIFEDLETLGAASTDGEFIVATGTGAFAYETGATARTSLGVGTGDSPQFTGLTLSGDLTVNGTTTTVNSTTVSVTDKAIVVGAGASDAQVASAGGAGLNVGADSGTGSLAYFKYDGSDRWDLSDDLNLITGQEFRINDNSVLNATTLSTAVVGSSLTSVGTIGNGVWQGTAIAGGYIANDAIDSQHIAQGGVDADCYESGSIISDHLAGSVADSKLSQITTGNKVAGSAVQLASDTAFENDSGLKLNSNVVSNGLTMTAGNGYQSLSLNMAFNVTGTSNSGTAHQVYDFTSANGGGAALGNGDPKSMMVFVNGILQRSGSGYDYLAKSDAGASSTVQVTFHTDNAADDSVYASYLLA